MRPAVAAEDLVVEILDADAQPRNAQVVQGVQLFVGQRAGLRFEGDLFDLIPGKVFLQSREKPGQLLDGEERRRAAAEVRVARPPAGQEGVRLYRAASWSTASRYWVTRSCRASRPV